MRQRQLEQATAELAEMKRARAELAAAQREIENFTLGSIGGTVAASAAQKF